MNKTVIKKRTAMSTVFKKITQFVMGVVLLLVLGAEYAAAQNNNNTSSGYLGSNPFIAGSENPMGKWRFGFTDDRIKWSHQKISLANTSFWLVDGDGNPVPTTNYTVEFVPAVDKDGGENVEPQDVQVIIKGKGTYNGHLLDDWYISATGTRYNGTNNATNTNWSAFTIVPRPLNDGVEIINVKDYSYTGSPITQPEVKVIYAQGTTWSYTLQEGVDYTITYNNNTDVTESASFTISPIGNKFTGPSVTETFKIKPVQLNDQTKVSVSYNKNAVYTGCGIKPQVTLTYNGKTLVEGTDYTVSYKNNTNAKKADAQDPPTIIIEGGSNGNFTGSTTRTFTIDPADIQSANPTVGTGDYDGGNPVKPNVQASLNSSTCSSPYVLSENTDFTLTYSNEDIKKAGTTNVKVTGKGNFTGETTIPYTIEPRCLNNNSNVSVQENTTYDLVYNGKEKGPATPPAKGIIEKVFWSTTELVNGTDYYITYSSNTNAGQATAYIHGMGNYSSEDKCIQIYNFTITPRKVTIEPEAKSKLYGETDPTLTRRITSGSLINDNDLGVISVKRVAGEAPGTYQLSIEYTNDNPNYDVTLKTNTFTIEPLCIDGFNVDLDDADKVRTYTGTAISLTKDPKVYKGATELVKGTDYEIQYENNTNVGTATVKIVGKGGYTKAGCNIANATFQITSVSPTISLSQDADRCDGTATVRGSFSGSGYYHYKWDSDGGTITSSPTQGNEDFSYGTSTQKQLDIKDMPPEGVWVTMTVKWWDGISTPSTFNQSSSAQIKVENYKIATNNLVSNVTAVGVQVLFNAIVLLAVLAVKHSQSYSLHI